MAFSFLNGKSPFDEAEERLEAGDTINGKPKMPKVPAMGWQDGVFLLVVIGLVVGGYQYYQYVKKNCAESFAACDALYAAAATDASKYAEVETCYEATWDLAFVSDTLEVLRQNRLGEIEDMRNAQKDLIANAKDALAKNDSATALKIVGGYKGADLLFGSDREIWDELAAAAKNAPAAEAPKAEEPKAEGAAEAVPAADSAK